MHFFENVAIKRVETPMPLKDNQVIIHDKTIPEVKTDNDCDNYLATKKLKKNYSSSDLVVCAVNDDIDKHNEILETIIQEARDRMKIVNFKSISMGEDEPFRKVEEILPVFCELQSHLKTHLFRNNAFETNEKKPLSNCLNYLAFLANCMFYPSPAIVAYEKLDFLQPTSLCTFNDHKLNIVIAEDLENVNLHGIEKYRKHSNLEDNGKQSNLKDKSCDGVSDIVAIKKSEWFQSQDSFKSLGSLMDESFATGGDASNQEESVLKFFHFFANFRNVLKKKEPDNKDNVGRENNIAQIPEISYRDDNYSFCLDNEASQFTSVSIETLIGLPENNQSIPTLPAVLEINKKEKNDTETCTQHENIEYSAHIIDTESRTFSNGVIDTVYIIEVNETENGKHRVEHCYNVFHRLHLDLSQERSLMQSNFPQNYGPFAKLVNKAMINQRIVVLNLWLHELTSHLAWGKISGDLRVKCINFLNESDDCRIDLSTKQSSRAPFKRAPFLSSLRKNSSCSQFSEDELDTIDDREPSVDDLLETKQSSRSTFKRAPFLSSLKRNSSGSQVSENELDAIDDRELNVDDLLEDWPTPG